MSVQEIAEVLIDELFAQSKTHSDAADAPTVWQSSNEWFVHIDGAVNVLALARAVIQSI
jgi:hypothetical protein